MKKLILMIPAIMLIGCGQFKQNESSAQDVIAGLSTHLTEEDQQAAANLDPEVLQQPVLMSSTEGEDSITLDISGVQTKIDFLNDENIAFLMNGIEVTHQIANDPKSLQALLMSLVNSQIGGVLDQALGVDAAGLIQQGLRLFTGKGSTTENVSSLLGIMARGFFNVFIRTVPYGNIIAPIAAPIVDGILDSVFGENDTNGGDNVNTGNSTGGLMGGILDGIFGNNDNKDDTNDASDNNGSLNNSIANGLTGFLANLFK